MSSSRTASARAPSKAGTTSAQDFYPGWEEAADTTVAIPRTDAGRDPHNRALTDLVGELATQSDAFRTRWAAHDVRHTGTKRFRHPLVGDLTVAFNATELPADPGLTLTVYTAEPGSPTEENLALLASWAAVSEGTGSRCSQRSASSQDTAAAARSAQSTEPWSSSISVGSSGACCSRRSASGICSLGSMRF